MAKCIGKKAPGIIGIGIAAFYFAEDAQAHGVAGAAARATPLLGDYIAIGELIDEEEQAYLQRLEAPVMRAHQRAAATARGIIQYELDNRACKYAPDEAVIMNAMLGLYNNLQSQYLIEESGIKAANINRAVKEFQDTIDKACNNDNRMPLQQGCARGRETGATSLLLQRGTPLLGGPNY